LNNKSENLKQHNNILTGPPGYALAQDLKKRFPTEKIRPVMLVLPSHAGNRKKPDYNLLSIVKFCFI